MDPAMASNSIAPAIRAWFNMWRVDLALRSRVECRRPCEGDNRIDRIFSCPADQHGFNSAWSLPPDQPEPFSFAKMRMQ